MHKREAEAELLTTGFHRDKIEFFRYLCKTVEDGTVRGICLMIIHEVDLQIHVVYGMIAQSCF